MSTSWENVKRVENLSQMMQKDRNGELGENAAGLGSGWQGDFLPRGNRHQERAATWEPRGETAEPLAGSAGKMEEKRQSQAGGGT